MSDNKVPPTPDAESVASRDIRTHALATWFREGDQVTHRVDFFLVFHGILLEAFFGAGEKHALHAVAFLGISTAIAWQCIGTRQSCFADQLGRLTIGSECNSASAPVLQTSEIPTAIKENRVMSAADFAVLLRHERPREAGYAFRVRAIPVFAKLSPALVLLTWLIAYVVDARSVDGLLGRVIVAFAGCFAGYAGSIYVSGAEPPSVTRHASPSAT